MSRLTRRSMITSSAALAAVPLSTASVSAAAATAGPDPIYAAIEVHRRAEQRYGDFLGTKSDWERSIGGYTDEHGNDRVDYEVVEAHPDWAKWESAEEEQDTAFEERIALLETVPTTLAGLAALQEYVMKSEVGSCLCCSANELVIFLETMHHAANSFAGLPAPGEFTPADVAAMARQGRANARENARRAALENEQH